MFPLWSHGIRVSYDQDLGTPDSYINFFLVSICRIQRGTKITPNPPTMYGSSSQCLTFASSKIIQLQLVSLFGPFQHALGSKQVTGAGVGLVVSATSLGKESKEQ